MGSILLKGCKWILTQDEKRRILKDQSIYIEDEEIKEIGKKVGNKKDYVIDGRNHAVAPGLINLHTHSAMTLVRGYADDMPLQEWLEKKIWPIERKLRKEQCYIGSLLACLEMIKTGTTCFLDMYYFEEETAKAIVESGIRGYISAVMFDFMQTDKIHKIAHEVEKLIRHVKSIRNQRVNVVLGPHALYTCSKELLLKAKEIADREKLLIHIHLAESRHEQTEFEVKYKRRQIEFLDEIGFLDANIIGAHCVWLTKTEIKMMGEHGMRVAHCPISNMKLAQGGVAPLPEMFANNIIVGLGTDGAASNNNLDIFDTMKFCALIHKAHRWDPTVLSAQETFDLATVKGAAALDTDDKLGSIEVGKKADIILLNLKEPNMVPIYGENAILSHIVYSAKGQNVNTVIVNGKILMEDRKILTLNEEEIYREAQEESLNLIN